MNSILLDAASPVYLLAGVGVIIVAGIIVIALIIAAIFIIRKIIKKNK